MMLIVMLLIDTSLCIKMYMYSIIIHYLLLISKCFLVNFLILSCQILSNGYTAA